MRDRALRAIAECHRIAAMTEQPGRITRRFLTPPVRDVHALLSSRMNALNMSVRIDPAGNLRGLWHPPGLSKKRLILGSHIDTVPDAGAFDGVLGVMLALEWVELAQELHLPLPIEVIAFSEEEGVRFSLPFIGSRAVAGRFGAELFSLRDADGLSLEAVLRVFGLDPERMKEAELDADAYAFVEMHIEQGPVLEAENLALAVVTAIAGQSRMRFYFTGQANHAGTTPMNLRRDALAGAAECIAAVEALARQTDGLVATVGRVEVEPNAGNVVPGAVRLGVEVRHAHDAVRIAAVATLQVQAEAIATRRKLQFESVPLMEQPAVPMDDELTRSLAGAVEAARYPLKHMPSGAGHDAMVLAARVPTAMLFLRSPGGISHHPGEAVREEDVEAALHVGCKFLERLASDLS